MHLPVASTTARLYAAHPAVVNLDRDTIPQAVSSVLA